MTGRFVLLKAIGGPGSLGFLILGTAVGVALILISARTRKWGRLALVMLAVNYTLLSLPVVAHLLAGPGTSAVSSQPSNYGRLEDIFVLDGDNYRTRAEVAANVARSSDPATVWVVGHQQLRDVLLAFDIPKQLLNYGGQAARTTHDQVSWIRTSMQGHTKCRAAVIVSRLHAPRVRALVRRAQLDILVIPAPIDREPPVAGPRVWLPSYAGLMLSRDAIYELAALAYHRWNGLL